MTYSLSLLLALLLAVASGPDRVKLNDGKVLEGRVVHEGRDSVVLRENKKDRAIPRTDIAELTTLERSLASITAREVPAGNAAALATLAEDCAKSGLEAEAHLMWLRVLLAESTHAGALAALDARAGKDDVTLRLGKEQRKLSELRERQAKWKDAYELQTTHFLVRTDVALQRALDMCMNLERFHKTFYDVLGQPLELYVFDERELPELRVYADAHAYPNPPTAGDRVWFGPVENCLHIAADQPVSVPTVVYELSRQMLFSALRRGSGKTAEVPAWVSIGIAEYFARAAPEKADLPWPSAAIPIQAAFQRAAVTDVKFERLFRAVQDDFESGAQAGDYSACAYTLLHFFAHGRDGALREGFGQYVREGAKGKLSLDALTKHVGLQAGELDKAWREYVSAQAQ